MSVLTAKPARSIRKVLIANRGEIAVRILRSLREQGLASVAVFSEADRLAPHVGLADEARCIGPAPALESYLDTAKVIAAAQDAGADAIHPGYGFLSENPDFAQAVLDAGLTFIGPTPAVIRQMGNKLVSRELAKSLGVPTIPAIAPGGDNDDLLAKVRQMGFPVLIKAAAGGGGKGMHVVHEEAELLAALAASQRESFAAFKSDQVFVERYLERPRHIEVQILGDQHGQVIHLGERECSVQRRHQKVVEESPAPRLTAELRGQLCSAALRLAGEVGYTSAGTVEFIVDREQRFYLLEMNTRLQVEHPVTEWTTGIDIVAQQLAIAQGQPLGFSQAQVASRGHAIECRLYAEDPEHDFLPCPGTIGLLREPAGAWVRHDCGVRSGSEITGHYDPMISKLSVWGPDRPSAVRRMQLALADTVILGLTTNREYLQAVVGHPAFVAGELHTGFLAEALTDWHPDRAPTPEMLIAAALSASAGPKQLAGSGQAGPSNESSPWQTLGGWGR